MSVALVRLDSVIDGEFYDNIIWPLVASRRRMAGHVRFLRGWSWGVLDRWARFHGGLTMPILLVWGRMTPSSRST